MSAVLPASGASVRKTLTVHASVDHAFKVFTEGFDGWWPRGHHIGKQPMKKAVLEPRLGGRCYGQSADGTDADWGSVLVWEPPRRLVIAWQITPDWQYEPDLAKCSEVEVRFMPERDDVTRVELEHRHFEKHGAGGDSIREAVGGPGGWGGILELFRGAARTFNSVLSPLAGIFSINDLLITRALDGLDEQQLWRRTTEHTNPLLWIVGHVVQTRAHARALFGEPLDTGWGGLFEQGALVQEASRYPALSAMSEKRTAITTALMDTLASMTADALAGPPIGPAPPGAKTVADQIGFFAMHDSYHVGQLGYIRKALGKPGIAR